MNTHSKQAYDDRPIRKPLAHRVDVLSLSRKRPAQPRTPCPTILRRDVIRAAEKGLEELDFSRFESLGQAPRRRRSATSPSRERNTLELVEARYEEACAQNDDDVGVFVHAASGEAFRLRANVTPKRTRSMCDVAGGPGSGGERGLRPMPSPRSRAVQNASTQGYSVFPPSCPAILNHISPDYRVHVNDTKGYPARAFVSFKGGGYYGSGCFVGPKHVLCAAHSVFDCIGDSCGWRETPPPFVTDGLGISRQVVWYWIPQAWFYGDTNNINIDYALMILREHGNYSAGCFAISDNSNSDLAALLGYGRPSPAVLCGKSNHPVPFFEEECEPYGFCGGDLYGTAMNVWKKRKYWFQGDAQTQAGMSGMPWFKMINGVPRVYGVHSRGNGTVAVAKRLRSSSVSALKSVMAEFPHSYWGLSCG